MDGSIKRPRNTLVERVGAGRRPDGGWLIGAVAASFERWRLGMGRRGRGGRGEAAGLGGHGDDLGGALNLQRLPPANFYWKGLLLVDEGKVWESLRNPIKNVRVLELSFFGPTFRKPLRIQERLEMF